MKFVTLAILSQLISTTTVGISVVPSFIDKSSNSGTINVVEAMSPPKFKQQPSWPQSTYYDEFGPPISLSCDLVPENGTTLLWYKDGLNGTSLKQTSTLVIENKNQTLRLALPVRNQTGYYTCFAFNTAGNISYTGLIFISPRKQETRPRVVLTDPDSQVKHARLGENVTISCTFDVGGSTSGLFDFDMNWHKKNTPINDSDHTTWGLNETKSNDQVLSLTIHSFKASDYGSYKCIGVNHKGNDSRIVSILPHDVHKGKLSVTLIIVITASSFVLVLTVTVSATLLHRYRRNRKYETLEWDEPDVGNYDVPKYKQKFDVFVSYSHEDLTWVKDFLFKTLTDKSYEVCLDFKDFIPGMATSENIIDAIYTSRKTIVLMSKHFLKSTWGQFELQQAHYRAISQRKDVLILVKIDNCKVPAKLMGKTFLDWNDVKVRPHFWDRLFEALGEPGNFTPDERLVNKITREPDKDDNTDDEELIDITLETHNGNFDENDNRITAAWFPMNDDNVT